MGYAAYFIKFFAFFLSVVPFALLLFLPSILCEKECFRIRPVMAVTILAICLIVMAAPFPFFSDNGILNGYLFLASAFCFLVFASLVRISATEKTTSLYTAFMFKSTQSILVLTIECAKDLSNVTDLEAVSPITAGIDAVHVGLMLVTDLLLLPLAVLFAVRIMRPCLQYLKPAVLWLDMGMTLLFNVVMLLTGFFFVGVVLSVGGSMWILALCVLPLAAGQCLVVLFTFKTSLSMAREIETAMEMKLVRENAKTIQRELERSRIVFHDLRQLLRQLHTISGQDSEQLKPYIEKITELAQHSNIFFCENKCLNSLFQYYTGFAASKQIPISISAAVGEVCISDADLSILISNAMENAVTGAEEYQQQTGQSPMIAVAAGIVKNRLAFQVDNSCASVRYAPFISERERSCFLSAEAFLSSHEGGGHGLQRMQYLARNYQGNAHFRFDSEKRLWTTRINLSVRRDETYEDRYL